MIDAGWKGVRFSRRSFAAGTAALAAATCGPLVHSALASPVIVIDQPVALIDAAVAIELRGFAPRQPVTIMALQTFPSTRWRATATFMSDDEGCVYVARQAPVSGTYDGVSAMGLIWSAERLPGEVSTPPAGDFIMQPWFVQLEATSPDGTRAELTFERRVAGPGVTRHPIRTGGIVGTLFLPPGDGPHPAVIVLTGGGGGIDEYRGAILASHGYAALNLGYFAMEGLPRGLVNMELSPVLEPERPVAFAPFYLSHLRDVRAVERATIPVEKTRGPILLLSGADDQMWPSSALADIAMRRLETHRHPYPFRHLKYEGAGHLILVPGGPRTTRTLRLQVEGMADRLLSMGGTPKADAEAGVDAWRSLLEFLEASIKGRK